MNDSLRSNLERGELNSKANRKFLLNLKKMNEKKLDALFSQGA